MNESQIIIAMHYLAGNGILLRGGLLCHEHCHLHHTVSPSASHGQYIIIVWQVIVLGMALFSGVGARSIQAKL